MFKRLALIALLALPAPAYAANTFLLYQQALTGFGLRLTNDPNNAGNGVNNNIICDAGGTAALCATVTAAGALKVDGSAVTQPVSGTFWQATQPVSGTFWQATQPVSIASMPSTPVTGTFWQATQPVSEATLDGAITSSVVQTNEKQINGIAPLMGNGVSGTGSQRVNIASDNTAFSVNAVQSGTWTIQPGNTANTTAWKVDGSAVTQPISAASLPPPRGVASTNASSTITTTNTFQQIFAASARGGCAVQNNDVNNMWVFFGTTGSATKATSIIIPPGGTINCNNGTAVLIDAVQITGTSTGVFYANQN
jgi:hypothetical protein